MSVLFFIVIIAALIIFGGLACGSYNRMLFLEQELIIANKEIPHWITFRKKFIKDLYEKWQKHPVKAFLMCALLVAVIFLIGWAL